MTDAQTDRQKDGHPAKCGCMLCRSGAHAVGCACDECRGRPRPTQSLVPARLDPVREVLERDQRRAAAYVGWDAPYVVRLGVQIDELRECARLVREGK